MEDTYGADTDTLETVVIPAARVAESDECKQSVIIGYDADGYLVLLEFLGIETGHRWPALDSKPRI